MKLGAVLYSPSTNVLCSGNKYNALKIISKLYKCFPVLAGSETAGSEMMILRAVTLSGTMLMPARLPYDLVERTVQRIQEKYPAISRVFYDQTPTQLGKESFS